MPARYGVIADDLTGACDAGVEFVKAGFQTTVWLDFETGEEDVTVLCTSTRSESADQARATVRRACLFLTEHGIPVVFKKIDSTLYGNIPEEIDAAIEASGVSRAWVCPAFPAMGRTVREGRLYVHGEPRLHLSTVLTLAGTEGFDASTDSDLDELAARSMASSPAPLLAGSAGLARALARQLGASQRPVPCPVPAREGPVVWIIGSDNAVTAAQLARLCEIRPLAGVLRIGWTPDDMERIRDRAAAGAFVISGGDTALRVCAALGARGIRLEAEVLPGIPRGTLIGGLAAGAAVITKAGGFGQQDALERVSEYLDKCGLELQ